MFHTGGDTEEDVDFNVTSTSSSKLANLFSFEQTNKEQSLTYTAPKQPKKPGADEPKHSATASAPTVACAFPVHAFKFENQQYVSQGKLGAAIITNHDSLSYKLVLYKGKQVYVAMATITVSFVFKVQANKYRSFYDDQRDSWSILFDSEQNASELAKQIVVAKANSAGSNLNCVIVQDLNFGDETKGLETGDAAEVKYSGWLLQNHAIGQLFDSNNQSDKTMKIKIGKTKVIKGWEEGMIGMKCNQKRMIVIPPALGYGSQPVGDKIPAHSTLVFEVFVIKVKLVKEPTVPSTPSVNIEQKESLYVKKSDPIKMDSTASADESVKARGASISEQLSQSPKTEKAKIISRMAKMGMPMLPMQGSSAVPQSSESETEDDQTRRSLTSSPAREPSPKPMIKHRPRNPSHNTYTESQSIQPSMPQNVFPQQQMSIYQQQYPNAATLPYSYPFQTTQPMAAVFQHPMAPLAQAPPSSLSDTHLPVLMSESRAQNSEVRMVLSKIGDKVDLVLNKLDQVRPSVPLINQPSLPYMESTALVQNIERIVQENLRWKSELEDKTEKIQALNEKICVLLEKNQKLVEESNVIMEKRSDSFHSSTVQSQLRFTSLEKEKVTLSEELTTAASQISDLKSQLQKSRNEALEKTENQSSSLEKLREEMEKLNKELNEKNNILKDLESSLHTTEAAKLNVTDKLEKLQREILTVQSSNDSLSKDLGKSKDNLEKKNLETEEHIQKIREKYEEEIESLKKSLLENESNKAKDSHANSDSWKMEKLSMKKDLETRLTRIKELETLNLKMNQEIDSLKSAPNKSNLESKLKRAMTALYRSLQQEIEGGTSYDGSEILQILLQSIRTITNAMLESESTESDVPKSSVPSTEENVESTNLSNEVGKDANEENPSENGDSSAGKEAVPKEENLNKTESLVKEVSTTENTSTNVKNTNTVVNETKPSTVKIDNLVVLESFVSRSSLHVFGVAVSMIFFAVAITAFSFFGG